MPQAVYLQHSQVLFRSNKPKAEQAVRKELAALKASADQGQQSATQAPAKGA